MRSIKWCLTSCSSILIYVNSVVPCALCRPIAGVRHLTMNDETFNYKYMTNYKNIVKHCSRILTDIDIVVRCIAGRGVDRGKG